MTRGAGAHVVNGPHDHPLPHPRLPQDEDGTGVGRRDPANQAEYLFNGRALAHELAGERVLTAEVAHLATELRAFERSLQAGLEPVEGEGLLQEVLGALPEGLHGRLHGGVGRHHDARYPLFLREQRKDLRALPIRELDVQKGGIRKLLRDGGPRLGDVRTDVQDVPRALQPRGDGIPDDRVVVQNEDALGHDTSLASAPAAAGRMTRTVVPPSPPSMSSRPRWASTTRATTESPSPVPKGLVE